MHEETRGKILQRKIAFANANKPTDDNLMTLFSLKLENNNFTDLKKPAVEKLVGLSIKKGKNKNK